jgi:hypothetical protein
MDDLFDGLFDGLLDNDVSQQSKSCVPGEPEADKGDAFRFLRLFSAPDLPEIPSWEQGLKIAFYIPPILIDVVGNSLVILIVALNKKMRTTTNLLILNLSVSDIMVACFCMWIHLATQLQPGNLWPYGAFLCKVTSFVQGIAIQFRGRKISQRMRAYKAGQMPRSETQDNPKKSVLMY